MQNKDPLKRSSFEKRTNILANSLDVLCIKINIFAGVYSRGATPDPIPNSEVKSSCGDGIAWATMWESSTAPALFYVNPICSLKSGFFMPEIYLKIQDRR